MIDKSSPPVEYIIFELALINVVLNLSADSLKPTNFVYLAKTTSGIILTYSHMEINWIRIFVFSLFNYFICSNNTDLFPFVKSYLPILRIMESFG